MIKKILFATMLIISSISITKAQQLNYQGIARNANGVAISFQDVSIRLSIRDLIALGATLYSETRLVRTNQFGLINLVIGSPGAINTIGSISAINWAGSSKFLQVEIDPLGGTSFQNAGTSQLQSVPYAFFANAAYPVGPAGGDLLGSTFPNPIIAPLVVTTTKLADSAVTTEKIKNSAITNEKITDGTIQNIKLVNSIITLNGLVLNLGGSQSFVVDSAGTDVNIASANNIHRFNFPNASIINRGLITTTTQTIGGNKIFNKNITAASFIRNGGIAAQFLKADGSVDNNIYLTANQPIIFTATGDATGISTSSGTAQVLPLTLATVNSTVGTFGTNILIPAITVNNKGLVTNIITNTIPTVTSTTLGLLTAADWNTFNSKQNIIPLGITAQYFRGDLSLSNFQTDVRAQLSAGTNITYTNGQFGITNNSVTLNNLPLTLGGSQTFATGTGGIDFNISSLGTVHTFNIPTASTFARGLLTSTDYTNFNAAYSNRITSLTTNGPNGVATLGSNVLNIPTYALPAATGTALGGIIIGANISNSSGTISLNNTNITNALGSQSGNLIFASPNGSAGIPVFRPMAATDIPILNQSTTGNALTVTTNANLTGPITSTGNITAIASQTGTGSTFVMNNSPTLVTPTLGAATATSINGNAFTTGTYTLTGGGTFNSTLPSATGTIALNNGGNWTFTSQVIGDIAQASSTTAYSRLAAVATDNALISGGVGTLSSWGKVGLTTHVSGTLPINYGGTGAITKTTAFDALSPMTTAGDIIYGAASGTGTRLATGISGQILTLTAGLLPSWSTPASNNQWSILGNSGLVDGTNFLGTVDQRALRFRVFNLWAGEINPVTTNTSFGYESGLNNVATINTSNNTSFGHSALKLTGAGGVDNTAIGQGTLQNNILGDKNTAIGQGALKTNNNSNNTAVGQDAMQANTIGFNNTAIGMAALFTNLSGENNTAIGHFAAQMLTIGSGNTAIGQNSLSTNTTGSNNTAIGFQAIVTDGFSNSTAIGNGAIVDASNKVRIGNSSVTAIDVAGQLKVNANGASNDFTLPTGRGTANQVLTTAGNGTTSWAATGGTHTIGESYGGGIVFYVYDGGLHGLIGAITDQSTGIRWNGGSNTNTRARADGVGAGLKNTAIIIANQSEFDGNAFAATVCNEYSVTTTVGGVTTTYGDWYLPSRHELNLLYLRRAQFTGGAAFANAIYWSSSELDISNSWLQDFIFGNQNGSNKTGAFDVRAVRAF